MQKYRTSGQIILALTVALPKRHFGVLSPFQLPMFIVVCVTLLFIGILVVIKRNKYYRDNNYPPGPLCLPLIGSLWALGTNPLHFHASLSDLAQKWGSVFRLHIGNTPLIVITDPNIIKETFDGMNCPAILRYNTSTTSKIGRGMSMLFSFERSHWMTMRKAFSSMARNLPGCPTISQIISNEVTKLIAELDKHISKEVYLNPLLTFFTRNVFFQIALRRSWSYNPLTTEEQQFNESMTLYLENVTRPTDFFPAFDIFRKKSAAICEYHARRMESSVQQILDERRKDALPKGGQPRDFLDVLLIEAQLNDISDECLAVNLRDMVMAAAVTASDTVDWLILYLCEYKDIQDKCYKELTEKLQGRFPTVDDQAELPYLDSVIKEILRMRPAGPLAIPHVAEWDCTIGGYRVDKGSVVVKNFFGIGNSEKFFKNACTFDPDRWVRNPEVSPNLIPFGHGPTVCLGMPIAKQEVFLAAASLIQRYKFQYGPTSPAPDFVGEFKSAFNPSKWNTLILRR